MTNYMVACSLVLCMMRQPALVGETDVTPVADDEMIQHPNTEHLPCRDQPRGQDMIFLARRRIAAWMIVQKDDRSGGFLDGHCKHFARMHDTERQASFGHGGIT